MTKSRLLMAALVACVVAACVCGLAACSNSGNSASGGTAATVDGTEIPEQKVTDQIEQIREQSGLTETDQWGQFLVENDMTPSSVRQQIIDTLTEQQVIMKGAEELGIKVEDSEVDDSINNMKSNYENDEAWNKALEQAGFTEDSYRETVKESLYEQKVGEHFQEQAQITDEDIVTSAQTYASYYNGAKRSSHILIGVDDTSNEQAMAEATAKAQDLIAQINAGADFAELAKANSTDTSSAQNGGDVGWDQLNSFVTEYTDALANLELNQVSDPVTSQYGVHIIKVTDVYNAPEDTSTITSIEQIPEAFRSTIEDMAKSVKANSDYTAWLDEKKAAANIVVNDMPSGLPYDIDLSKYSKSESSSSSAESTSADSTSDTTTTTESAESAESSSSSEASTAEASQSTSASASTESSSSSSSAQ
ncbi:MAG: peptidylprolyl isomerase [Eggerthellaceae bacterium]|nr:peptidylprolyl isomerase [Eggerthellaceae bacterium]